MSVFPCQWSRHAASHGLSRASPRCATSSGLTGQHRNSARSAWFRKTSGPPRATSSANVAPKKRFLSSSLSPASSGPRLALSRVGGRASYATTSTPRSLSRHAQYAVPHPTSTTPTPSAATASSAAAQGTANAKACFSACVAVSRRADGTRAPCSVAATSVPGFSLSSSGLEFNGAFGRPVSRPASTPPCPSANSPLWNQYTEAASARVGPLSFSSPFQLKVLVSAFGVASAILRYRAE
mmetsp:Transcript_9551/g.40010  ORF Transcript_9551/g.40010 Transcript_9551/m.40010 type:complete len:239 (-) Transcript_9551:1670-2386(-)